MKVPRVGRRNPLVRRLYGAALRANFHVQTQLAYRRSRPDRFLHPYRVLRISPWISAWAYARGRRGLAHVEGGDWDLCPSDVDTDEEFRALQAVLGDGLAWEQTDWYRRVRSELDAGRPWFRLTTVEQLDRHCRRHEVVWQSMRQHGFLTQDRLRAIGNPGGQPRSYSEIVVSITREGGFQFADGRHRLCMARLLDLPTIPVQVACRHERWMERRRLIAAAVDGRGGAAPEPLGHPDLDNILADERRGRLVDAVSPALDALERPPETALDLDPAWGLRARSLAARGLQVTVHTGSDEDAGVLAALSRVPGAAYHIERTREALGELRPDVLLAGPSPTAASRDVATEVLTAGRPRLLALVLADGAGADALTDAAAKLGYLPVAEKDVEDGAWTVSILAAP